MTPRTPTPSVSVLGLGAMGRALARAFLAAGHPTIVWNRTPGRAGALVEAGAEEAPSATDAVRASDLVVLCLLDPAAVAAVADAASPAWQGTTVVNLTSSTPEDARELAARFHGAGARYLDGTIMVPTDLVGRRDALVLYSGDPTVFADHVQTLHALGGAAEHLGDDPGLAATHDLGMLDVFFTGMAAFLHAAALVGADGVDATRFVPYARRMFALLDDVVAGLATNVEHGEHDGTEDNLQMELASLEHIVHASRARGVDASLPQLTRSLVAAAIRDGHGADSFSRVIDVLRRPGAAAAAA